MNSTVTRRGNSLRRTRADCSYDGIIGLTVVNTQLIHSDTPEPPPAVLETGVAELFTRHRFDTSVLHLIRWSKSLMTQGPTANT